MQDAERLPRCVCNERWQTELMCSRQAGTVRLTRSALDKSAVAAVVEPAVQQVPVLAHHCGQEVRAAQA